MNAQSMSITVMRNNARFLTDRMAFTLGIRDPYLIDEIYRINYDYIWGVNDYLDDVAMGNYYDDYMTVVSARDVALRTLLGKRTWKRLMGYTYFHRPIVFANHRWRFTIYDYDRYGLHNFHFSAPRPYGAGYAGGHIVRPMAPRPVAPRVERRPVAAPGGHTAPRPHNAAPNTGAYRGTLSRGSATTAPRSSGNTRSSSRTSAGTPTRGASRR